MGSKINLNYSNVWCSGSWEIFNLTLVGDINWLSLIFDRVDLVDSLWLLNKKQALAKVQNKVSVETNNDNEPFHFSVMSCRISLFKSFWCCSNCSFRLHGTGIGNGYLHIKLYCSHCTEAGTKTCPIVSYCACPVPFPGPGPGPLQCQ